MKHKVLLAGKNVSIIDEFFYKLSNEFECMTTSARDSDIAKHVVLFQPEVFVYCFASETKEDIVNLVAALDEVTMKNIDMILIGDAKTCNEFLLLKPEIVSLVLHRPISTATIRERILKYFGELAAPTEVYKEDDIQKLIDSVNQMQKEMEAVDAIPPEGEQKHILVIDDDPMMLRLIKTELKDRYNVATAINGKIGLKFLEHKKTDLILLDYEMPEEDGVAVMQKLRANEATRNIPVVFLTGINDKEKIKKVLAMHPQGYLLKPIECNVLVEVIRQVLG